MAQLTALPGLLRRWCLTWGARPEEAERRIPGDDLLPEPDLVTTRVVTVEAPPSAVWPWLVQLGRGRGGSRACDWFESLVGLDLHSADRILPELQDVKIGDPVAMGTQAPRMRVQVLEPGHALAIGSADSARVWIFALYPENQVTRLVSRNRMANGRTSPVRRLISLFVIEPAGLLMERATLRGIKRHAERLVWGPADRERPTRLTSR